jgi:hypothetical protein
MPRIRCAYDGIGAEARNVHLGVFLCVHNGGNGNTEVGGRAPEVYTIALMSASIREPSLSGPAIERMRIHPAHGRSILRASSIHLRLLFPPRAYRVKTNGLSRSSPRPGWRGFSR